MTANAAQPDEVDDDQEAVEPDDEEDRGRAILIEGAFRHAAASCLVSEYVCARRSQRCFILSQNCASLGEVAASAFSAASLAMVRHSTNLSSVSIDIRHSQRS